MPGTRTVLGAVLLVGLAAGLAVLAAAMLQASDTGDGSSAATAGDAGPTSGLDASSDRSETAAGRPTDALDAVADDGGRLGDDPSDVYDRYREPDEPWFEEVAADVGLDYTGPDGRVADQSFLEGGSVAGVYVADVDRDRRPDVLALGDGPALFLNRGGRYERADALPPLDIEPRSALFVDHDNDGWRDLYLLGDRAVFLENVGGQFERRDAGLPTTFDGVRGASAADFTGDGCPGIFVHQAGDWRDRRPAGYHDRNVTVADDNGGRNRLFAGDCERFREITGDAAIAGTAWSLASSSVDLTGDGRPDVHVANDFNEDVIYVNRGDGSFDRRTLGNATNRNGMASEVADVDGDGRPDVFVTNIFWRDQRADAPVTFQRYGGRVEGNNLLLNRDSGFEDAAGRYGVRKGGAGWAAAIADLDGDGRLDLIHAVTHSLDNHAALWRGTADGRFERIGSAAAGIETSWGQGLAVLDHDGDGDVDLVESNLRGGQFRLYENRRDGASVAVHVEPSPRRTALGATVTVEAGGEVHHRWVTSGSDYASQDARTVHIGLGDTTEIERLTVAWPDGPTHATADVAPNDRVAVDPSGFAQEGPA